MWDIALHPSGVAGLKSAAVSVADSGAEAEQRRAEEVARAQAEFQSFYDRTARRLWAYLARASGDSALADDLTQETFLRYLRSGFEGESEDHRRGYLFRIGTNLLRDRRRRGWREVAETDDQGARQAPEPTERPGGEQVSLRRDLSRFFGRLEQRQRQLLWLAHVEGASHREIAAALKVREASVRPMLFRARQKLAALLRAEGLAPKRTA